LPDMVTTVRPVLRGSPGTNTAVRRLIAPYILALEIERTTFTLSAWTEQKDKD